MKQGSTDNFAVDRNQKPQHIRLQDVKERMTDTLKVFQERGVLAHREYGEDVPASLHGAPRTAEVCPALS